MSFFLERPEVVGPSDWVVAFVASEVSAGQSLDVFTTLLTPSQKLAKPKREFRSALWDEMVSSPGVPAELTKKRANWSAYEQELMDLRDQLLGMHILPLITDWFDYQQAWSLWSHSFKDEIVDAYDVVTVTLRGSDQFSRVFSEVQAEFESSAYRWSNMRACDVWGICRARRLDTGNIESIYRIPIEVQETEDRLFLATPLEDGKPTIAVVPFPLGVNSFLTDEEREEYASGVRCANAHCNSPVVMGGKRPKIKTDDWLDPQLVNLLTYPMPEYMVTWKTKRAFMSDGTKMVTMRIDAENPKYELPIVVGYLEGEGYAPFRDDDLPLCAIKVTIPKGERKRMKIEIRDLLEKLEAHMVKVHRHMAKKTGIRIDVPDAEED